MGLIGSVLQPLWAGMTVQLLTPADFVRDPGRWLRLVSEHRATTLMAPNFAYDLCVRRGRPRHDETLDLSSVRVALNGAEPVRPATLAAFNEAFVPHGLSATALTPAYGLAENTVGVSFSSDTPTVAQVFTARRSALVRGRYEPEAAEASDRIELVGCGVDITGVETAIVDPDAHIQLADGNVGEIWVTGASRGRGYHSRPAETAARFGAEVVGRPERWIRTGDLGVRIDGQLCVCGRLKDVIIHNGANHDPADVEATAVAVDARVAATAAAFAVPSTSGADAVVLLQEIRHEVASADASDLLTRIRRAISEAHGLRVDAVSLVPRGKLPKTTSGKIQRTRARQLWLDGALPVLATSRIGSGS
jgi:acyl-CoA synthetase (AMP-forming)/AMP-acid ligase II